MQKLKKLIKPTLIAFFIVAVIVVMGYAYTVFSNRYGQKSQGNSNTNQSSVTDKISDYFGGSTSNTNSNSQNENSNNNQNQNENSNVNANNNVNTDDSGEVTSKDCDNNCSRLKNNSEKYRYCQEFCGDIPVSKKNSEADCTNLSGLDKDVCWRDLAVSKLDASFCGKISDSKLQRTCRNRVSEELLN